MRLLYSTMTKKGISTIGFILVLAMSSRAQHGQVTGIIRTSDNKPAGQVNVQLKEIRKGTVSADNGTYTLSNIPEGTYTILVSFVGLQTIKKSVAVKSGETYNLDFDLVENENQLQEIVVSANRSI